MSRTRSVVDLTGIEDDQRAPMGREGGFDELDIHSPEAVPMLDDHGSDVRISEQATDETRA
jgi:hypothetical protein